MQIQFSTENTVGNVGYYPNLSFCIKPYQTLESPGFTKPQTSPEETNTVQLKPLKFWCLHGTDTYLELQKENPNLTSAPQNETSWEKMRLAGSHHGWELGPASEVLSNILNTGGQIEFHTSLN